MKTDTEALLERIEACHDDDPGEAAALIAALDVAGLPTGRHGQLAFLLNHVLGEKLARRFLRRAGICCLPVMLRVS